MRWIWLRVARHPLAHPTPPHATAAILGLTVILVQIHLVDADVTGVAWSEPTTINTAPSTRYGSALAATATHVYVFGGQAFGRKDDFWKYDISLEGWTELSAIAPKPSARDGHAMVAYSSDIYLFSGQGEDDYFRDFWRFDVTNSEWDDLSTPSFGSLPAARTEHAMAVLGDKMYVYGGWGGGALNGFFEYRFGSNAWFDLTVSDDSDPHPWYLWTHVLAAWDGKVYVHGGRISGEGTSAELWEYDTAAGTWADKSGAANEPAARQQHGMVAIEGHLIVLGGEGTSSILSSVFAYDIAGGQWQDLSTVSSGAGFTGRDEFGFGAAGRSLFVFACDQSSACSGGDFLRADLSVDGGSGPEAPPSDGEPATTPPPGGGSGPVATTPAPVATTTAADAPSGGNGGGEPTTTPAAGTDAETSPSAEEPTSVVLIAAAAGGVALLLCAAAGLWYARKRSRVRDTSSKVEAGAESTNAAPSAPQAPAPAQISIQTAPPNPAPSPVPSSVPSLSEGMVAGAMAKIAAEVAAGQRPSEFEFEEVKFAARELIMGDARASAAGLREQIGLDNKVLSEQLAEGWAAIEKEWLSTGDDKDEANYRYIRFGKACDPEDIPPFVREQIAKGRYHGGSLAASDFDKGHGGMRLEDFVKHDVSVEAHLTEFNVFALRAYTSGSFPQFNKPLRQSVCPHPLRMTLFYLDEGLRKLRQIEATRDRESYAAQKVLYRGMKNMAVDAARFARVGGTEMACMSTTADLEVALKYAYSTKPLLFRYLTRGNSRGVSIKFLSMFPAEDEYLYPPFTLVLSEGPPHLEGGVEIYDVSPQFS